MRGWRSRGRDGRRWRGSRLRGRRRRVGRVGTTRVGIRERKRRSRLLGRKVGFILLDWLCLDDDSLAFSLQVVGEEKQELRQFCVVAPSVVWAMLLRLEDGLVSPVTVVHIEEKGLHSLALKRHIFSLSRMKDTICQACSPTHLSLAFSCYHGEKGEYVSTFDVESETRQGKTRHGRWSCTTQYSSMTTTIITISGNEASFSDWGLKESVIATSMVQIITFCSLFLFHKTRRGSSCEISSFLESRDADPFNGLKARIPSPRFPTF